MHILEGLQTLGSIWWACTGGSSLRPHCRDAVTLLVHLIQQIRKRRGAYVF